MKVNVLNDCAHDWENFVRELKEYDDVDITHYLRTRGFFDKTFGVLRRIINAPTPNLWVGNYLLQDTYLLLKLCRRVPIVGVSHGSDLRTTIKSRKYGWIVKHCAKNVDKLFCTDADTLDVARKYNNNVEWLPIPIDQDVFRNEPLPKRDWVVVFYPCEIDDDVRRSLSFVSLFLTYQEEMNKNVYLRIIDHGKDSWVAKTMTKNNDHVAWLNKLSYPEGIRQEYYNSDIVIGTLNYDASPTVAYEAMACGRPVLNGKMETKEMVDSFLELTEYKARWKMAEVNYFRVNSFHNSKVVARRVYEVLKELVE